MPLWYKDHKLITLWNGANWMHKDHHQRGMTLILYNLRLYYQWAYRPVEYIHTVYTVYVHLCAICSAFPGRLITSNVFQYWFYFTIFFSQIALGTADLHVSVILVTKANAVTGELHRPYYYIASVITAYTWLMACMTVMSNSASPPTLDKSSHRLCTSHRVKPKSIAYFQRQISLHQKLSQKFRKWWKFSSHIKAKLHKKK